ncbi:hypothetical protein K2173_016588 [Erythroxylum novogranatense]|uniref:UFSP1/2/DUB catalytic domain-containing protein n=1 Tax=Erythroxylum novogranatense TaxID=1862640 RepID=A0AAV8SH54_9ROSI|nr:hypothetical protein K2173_016588 [Erythroxylum novogranatense]
MSSEVYDYAMDCFGSCPICNLTIPSYLLQRHANSHFEDDDDDIVSCVDEYLAVSQSLSLSQTHRSNYNNAMDEKISSLIGLQSTSSHHPVNDEGGLMALLFKCFELDVNLMHKKTKSNTVLLCGYVDHFHCMPSEDLGWGCGWRNIQMLSSHLLRRESAREVLFGGCGYVPDIPSLQRWLEIAWQKGFDAPGSLHFNHSIHGSQHWIGTTECAALFRSFGLRAKIVDFDSAPNLNSTKTTITSRTTGGNKGKVTFQVYGPMDRYLQRDTSSISAPETDALARDKSHFSSKNDFSHALVDWVWNYFSDGIKIPFSRSSSVIATDRMPLYFQHDGHSRTIVGIEVKRQQIGTSKYNLLILDPAHRTEALEIALKDNVGWEKLIKRGVHTLKKAQYQLCYVEPGIATRQEEMEQLKTLDSVLIEF